ncbi:uncharacterized protein G2W53_010718 [Senna tora]|uniref:Uncharacterized protein n=1 Tax=Senna tora TaxID=362788 RepID=A0A835CA22_9FABA|nr:uncharacterized protein G2W53_010718 [Senna tora]
MNLNEKEEDRSGHGRKWGELRVSHQTKALTKLLAEMEKVADVDALQVNEMDSGKSSDQVEIEKIITHNATELIDNNEMVRVLRDIQNVVPIKNKDGEAKEHIDLANKGKGLRGWKKVVRHKRDNLKAIVEVKVNKRENWNKM